MPIIIPEGYAQVVFTWRSPNFDSGGAATSFGIDRATMPESLEATAAFWADAWDDALRGYQDSSTRLDTVTVNTATESAQVVANLVGGTDLALPPPNVALLVALKSERRGPRGQGRMFLPAMVGENDIDEQGVISSVKVDALQAGMEVFTINGVPGSRPFVVLQRSEGLSPPINPPPAGIGVPQVQVKVATQRRRLRR